MNKVRLTSEIESRNRIENGPRAAKKDKAKSQQSTLHQKHKNLSGRVRVKVISSLLGSVYTRIFRNSDN